MTFNTISMHRSNLLKAVQYDSCINYEMRNVFYEKLNCSKNNLRPIYDEMFCTLATYTQL